MTHTYTPGLKVLEKSKVVLRRILPLQGSVLAAVGDPVKAESIVARAELPGDVALVNAVSKLGCSASELPRYMLKKAGDAVTQNELIAETQPFFKLFRSQLHSPIEGTIESISTVTGQLILRGVPRPVEITAFCDGTITDVIPNEGVVVTTSATFVQGIFGIGGEVTGQLEVVCQSPEQELTADLLKPEHADKILVGGSFVSGETLKQAVAVGVRGLVIGGFHDHDLRALLGYDLGVAITGHEQVGVTLIMTEGFGRIPMRTRTFELLKSRVGEKTSINGATQIRAGVMRPEIVIPFLDEGLAPADSVTDEQPFEAGLALKSPVRLIRQPYFGRLGSVRELPSSPREVPSGALARVAMIELDDGTDVVVPRANLEMIEE